MPDVSGLIVPKLCHRCHDGNIRCLEPVAPSAHHHDYGRCEYEDNVGRLADLGLKEVTLAALKEIRKAHPSCDGLRVLGNGEIKKAITVKADYVSPSAKEKIEAAGGKVELV